MTDIPAWAQGLDIFSKVATGCAGVGISYLLYRLHHRQYQIEREQSLDIKMLTDLSTRGGGVVVHVQVEIKNISKDRWCIPAVYLDAGVVPPNKSFVREDDFTALEPASVRTPGNLAFVRNSIKHLSPDEVETVTCTLQFPPEEVERHKVLMLRARIFGSDGTILGPLYQKGNMRNEWIGFAQDGDQKNTNFCFLRRREIEPIEEPSESNPGTAAPARPTGSPSNSVLEELGTEERETFERVAGPGRWVILRPPENVEKLTAATEADLEPDVSNTVRFARVLGTVNKWSQYKVVNLARTPDLTIAQVAVNPTGHGGHQPS
jgi:hypothetical protein